MKKKITLRNPKFLKDIKSTIQHISSQWISLANQLKEVHCKKMYQLLGCKSFRSFVVNHVPELGTKTAIKLLRIGYEYEKKLEHANHRMLNYTTLYALSVAKKDKKYFTSENFKENLNVIENRYLKGEISGNETTRMVMKLKNPENKILVKQSTVFKREATKYYAEIHEKLNRISIGYARNSDVPIDVDEIEKIIYKCQRILSHISPNERTGKRIIINA